MKDLEILHKLEKKLNIKFGNFETYIESKHIKANLSKIKNRQFILPESLQKQQLYSIDKDGNVIQLFLNGLGIKKVPSEVFKLKSLKRLDIVHNRLKEIPADILKLDKLETLLLFHNEIEIISPEVIFMKSLKDINLNVNPLRNIPVEVYQGERIKNNKLVRVTAIRDYLRSLTRGSRELNEIKVIVVGDGGSGKTSLQKLLIKEEFDPNESQTHGINIKHLKLRPKNKNVTYRLWDFGGQEIMHATHQFFLSKRCIYIIVLDAREEPNPEYWFNHVKSFGENSPVLIVINKIDENPSYEVNRRFLKEKYPNIIDFEKISCSKGSGIEKVKSALRNAVINIKNLNVQWANSWFVVKTYLENMTENYISYDDFTMLCEKNSILDTSSQNTLVEYLNDLGIILHFKDFALYDTHVLEPEWVTYAVYKILNSKKLVQGNGVLKLTDIRIILNKSEMSGKFKYPSSKLKYIIDLMIKFELCFEINAKEILIPDLLPVQEPEFHQGNGSLEVVLLYTFLPKSIMPRLIVNLHNDTYDNIMWRSGIVIEDKTLKTIAKISADYEEKNISISITGDKKRDYLSVILFIIRKIQSGFKGLSYKVNIPLIGDDITYVSYHHLLKLESKGIYKYLPDGMDKEIDVLKVLGNYRTQKSSEEQIFDILDKLTNERDNPETIVEKANDIIQIQPNFFGLGINLNALVKKYLKRK